MQTDNLVTVSIFIHTGRIHPFYVLEETINYKLKIAGKDGLKPGRARIVTAGFEVKLDILNEKISGQDKPASMYIPPNEQIDFHLLRNIIFDKPEQPATILYTEIQPARPEEHIENEAGKKDEVKLQTQ